MKLEQLQSALLLDVTGCKDHSEQLENYIASSKNADAQTRLDLYRTTVQSAHLSSLNSAFPVIREILGHQYWRQLLQSELRQLGTSCPDLHRYGSFMPTFLKAVLEERSELAEYTYLPDLAMLEWTVHQTQFCKDEARFDWTAFNHIALEEHGDTILNVSKTLTLLHSKFEVDRLWHSHQATSHVLPETLFDELYCCVYRRSIPFTCGIDRLTQEDHATLNLLQTGVRLNQLVAITQHTPEQLIDQLFEWINKGYIIDFQRAHHV